MIYTDELVFATQGFWDIMDITPAVEEALSKSRVSDGLVTVLVVC